MNARVMGFVVPMLLVLASAGCGDGADPSATTRATTTTAAPPTPSITTTGASTTTSPPIDSYPGYLRYGQPGAPGAVIGLQRVIGAEIETLVTERVVWAADDRAGGVVFTYEPSGPVQNLWRIPIGSTEAVLVAADVDPFGDPILVDGATLVPVVRPVHPRDLPPPAGPLDCDYDAYQHGYVDIDTGEMLVLDDCVDLEGDSPLPATAVDNLALHIEGNDAWPGATDLPAPSFRFAEPVTGRPVDVPANPHSDPCYGCRLDPRLAPDGRTLLINEQIPEPADLGLDTWDDLEDLTFDQRWTRWSRWADWTSPEPAPSTTLRIVDLQNGRTLGERSVDGLPAANQLLGFDGRFVAYRAWDNATTIIDMLGETAPVIEDGWQIALLHGGGP